MASGSIIGIVFVTAGVFLGLSAQLGGKPTKAEEQRYVEVLGTPDTLKGVQSLLRETARRCVPGCGRPKACCWKTARSW